MKDRNCKRAEQTTDGGDEMTAGVHRKGYLVLEKKKDLW